MKPVMCSLALVLAATLASVSHAGSIREECGQDVMSFCRDVQPGGGRIIHCLQDHYKELSDGCYAALQSHANGQGGSGGKHTPHENGNNEAPPQDGDDNQQPDSGTAN